MLSPRSKGLQLKECQTARRTEYHRRKLAEDTAYVEQCRDSRKQWRENNKTKLKQYRRRRREEVLKFIGNVDQTNRERLITLLQKNSLLDLRQCEAEIWLLSPRTESDVKNIFARANILILSI